MDVSSEVVSDVEIRLPTGDVYHQLVISEYTPKFCKRCKSFGHLEGSCGKLSEGGQHKPYVARKKGVSVGVGMALYDAPKTVERTAVAPEVDARVADGAGPADLGVAHAVGDVALRPAVAWMPPCPVQPPPCPPVMSAVGRRATASIGKQVLETGRQSIVEGTRLGPVYPELQPGSSGQGAPTTEKKGKKKKKAGKRDVAHAQQLSEGEDPLLEPYPNEDLEDCLEGWKIGGKKGGRKK